MCARRWEKGACKREESEMRERGKAGNGKMGGAGASASASVRVQMQEQAQRRCEGEGGEMRVGGPSSKVKRGWREAVAVAVAPSREADKQTR